MILKRSVLSLCCIYVALCCARDSTNVLKEAFLHQGSDTERSLELGKLVLYFSDRADFTLLPIPITQSAQKNQNTYFFPQTKVTAEVQKAIERIQHTRHAWYSVQISPTQKPIEGIRVTVAYDPTKVEVHDQFFDSIQLNKAIEIIFYNKELKKKLVTGVQAPVLRRAANDKKYGVIVDCGHGGKDTGAIGYQVQEKEVTLSVGMRLAALLEQRGVEVFLTRNTDAAIPIDPFGPAHNERDADQLFVMEGPLHP